MTIGALTAQVEQLCAAMHAATAEVDARIAQAEAQLKALRIVREVALEPYAHTRDTLVAALRLRVLEEGVPRVQSAHCTWSRTERVQWDDAGVQAFAQEQPSVLQFRQVMPSTTWRWRYANGL